MARTMQRRFQIALIFFLVCCSSGVGKAESGSISGRIELSKDQGQPKKQMNGPSNIVVWLTPLATGVQPINLTRANHFRLIQKDKQFSPHLLVIPVGSSVEFPNLDPFYHNVFSLFNGKRFDLGLYEAGSTRTVRFDLAGISYIFCNIHPEMGAVIVSLATPYFAVASTNGNWAVQEVPDGTYEFAVWAEGVSPRQLDGLKRQVHIGPSMRDLGVVHVVEDMSAQKRKNKFGEDYFPSVKPY